MQKNRPAKKLRPAILASVLALSCSLGWAARDFTPQAGTWVISEELDGKPGRGLAIDVQGNTFFMQVFGYEKNGDASFYTAIGQMDGNAVTAPLMQYQGGRSFGSDARDAVELGSPGQVKLSFANGLQGAVQFPGEPERAIQRFEMRSADFISQYWEQGHLRRFLVSTLDSQQTPSWTSHIWLRKSAAGWTLTVAGMPGYADEILACQQLPDKDAYRCSDSQSLTADGPGAYIRSIALRIANADIAGTVEMQGQGGVQTHQLMGIATVGKPGASITGCASFGDVYVGDIVNCTRAVTPSSGTWLVEDELTYKPGRGMALDVQNGMALAQVFNYLPNGAPSFHMGSGSYAGWATQFALNRYRAGRALGGPPASAELADTAGNLTLEFLALSNQRSIPSRVRGRVAFPSEPKKTMVRMALEPGADTAEGLLGQWWMGLYTDGLPELRQPITLSRIEGNQAVSDDGQVRCQRYPEPDYTSRANCDWNHNGRAYRAYLYQEPGNRSGNVLQVRDRHGNLMGLGNVPLE